MDTTKTTTFQDAFSEEIWKSTYKDYKDSDINATFRRVAKSIASAEKTPELKLASEESFYDLLTNFKGVSGGRITANAGTEWTGTTFANCYVGPLPDSNIDSIEGIYSVLLEQAKTLKSEGGWGMDFSWIRPRGSFIAGIGVESPGAIRFMELFDKSSEIVTAGSGKKNNNKKSKEKIRKGAQMATMGVWHPDVIEFITAKQSGNKLTKFNMSVDVSDEFMEKVNALDRLEKLLDSHITDVRRSIAEIDKWDLVFPDTSHEAYKKEWRGSIRDWKSKGYPVIVHSTVKVSWLWNLIMESTYNRNEPGVLFLDRANYFAPFNYGETILSTNPCLHGDVLISTNNGKKTIKSLVDDFAKNIPIYVHTMNIETGCIELEQVVDGFQTSPDSELVELLFDDGKKIKVTPNHRIYTSNRGYVEAINLTTDDDVISN